MQGKLRTAGLLLSASLLASGCSGNEPADPPAGASRVADVSSPAAGTGSPETDTPKPDGAPYSDRYNFTATTFDGETFELAAHKGTPVVINFWESW